MDESASRAVCRPGFYEAGTLHAMRQMLRPGSVFVDAGASVGLMSLFASQLVGDEGRVLAFASCPQTPGSEVQTTSSASLGLARQIVVER